MNDPYDTVAPSPGDPKSTIDHVALGLSKDVFISYATPDREAAYRLCRLLEKEGIGCWIAPRDVTPGVNYAEAIIRAIEGTPSTILLLSTHANASIHVAHEVERATSKRKRVIPVRLENIQPGPSLELHLATAHWLDAFRFSPEQVAAQLALVLRSDCGSLMVSPNRHELILSWSYSRHDPIPDLLPQPPAHPGLQCKTV